MSDEQLQFRVTGKITRLLGRESVSEAITALFEILKNSHDADALSVTVQFTDILSENGKITIREENGDGMTIEDIKNKFFVIGTYSKEPINGTIPETKRHKRIMLGRKGVGRFALERLGEQTKIISKPIDTNDKITFFIDWNLFEPKEVTVDQIHIGYNVEKRNEDEDSGLDIEISGLRETWDERSLKNLESKIQRLILPKELQPKNSFKIFFDAPEFGYIRKEITVNLAKRAYYSLTADLSAERISLLAKIKGESVISPQKKNDIITEFEPFEYGDKITKQELKTGTKYVKDLTCGPTKLIVYYFPLFQKGSPERRDALQYYGEAFAHLIDTSLSKYSGVRIFRDGLREFIYGDLKHDWVERSGISRNLSGTVQADRLIGFVLISNKNNPDIKPTTSRETAIENQAFLDLREFVIQSMLEFDRFLNRLRRRLMEDRYNIKRDKEALNQLDLVKTKLENPKGKIRTAFSKFTNLTGTDLSPELNSVLDAVDVARQRIKSKIKMTFDEMAENQVEKSLASFGYMTGVMSHETEDSISILSREVKKIKNHLEGTEKLSSKELTVIMMNLLEPSTFLKQWSNFIGLFTSELASENPDLRRSEIINPFEKAESFKKSIKRIWKINSLEIQNEINPKLRIRMFTVFFYSIIGNLLTNSIKAINSLDDRGDRDNLIQIKSEMNNDYFILYFSDNAMGIPKERWERVFDPHVSSTKKDEIFRGHGMGLSIVQSILYEYNGEIKIIEPLLGDGTTFRIKIPWHNIDPEKIPEIEQIIS